MRRTSQRHIATCFGVVEYPAEHIPPGRSAHVQKTTTCFTDIFFMRAIVPNFFLPEKYLNSCHNIPIHASLFSCAYAIIFAMKRNKSTCHAVFAFATAAVSFAAFASADLHIQSVRHRRGGEGIDDRAGFCPLGRRGEEPILSSHHKGTDGILSAVVVHGNASAF